MLELALECPRLTLAEHQGSHQGEYLGMLATRSSRRATLSQIIDMIMVGGYGDPMKPYGHAASMDSVGQPSAVHPAHSRLDGTSRPHAHTAGDGDFSRRRRKSYSTTAQCRYAPTFGGVTTGTLAGHPPRWVAVMAGIRNRAICKLNPK